MTAPRKRGALKLGLILVAMFLAGGLAATLVWNLVKKYP